MSIEAFIRLFDDVFTNGHLDAADHLVAPDIIEHQFAPDGSPGRTMTRDRSPATDSSWVTLHQGGHHVRLPHVLG